MKGTLLATAVVAGAVAAVTMPATGASADEIRDKQWHLEALSVSEAHKLTTGGGVDVAVVDTGVQPHRDLAGALRPGTSLVSGQRGNGQADDDSHGTGMAGLIAGRGHGDGAGVLGIAPDAAILPVRVQAKNAIASSSLIGNGIIEAIREGADVVNVSLAAPASREMKAAADLAAEKDVLLVAGIGNTSVDIRGGYPAILPGVLAVGATDRQGERDKISIRDERVSLCAPGTDIVSTSLNNRYRRGTGTSDSTAIVSGAAALVRSKFPELSAREVMHRLTATADDNGPPGRDDQCGYGVLNIVKALTADVPPLPATPPPSTGPTDPTTTTPPAQAAPDQKTRSTNVPAIAGGVAGAVLVGGLGALLVARRRRSAGPDR